MKKLIVLFLLATSACSSSGDGTPIPVAPEVKKASLVVDVRGLPAGLSGSAVLQNGATVVNVTSSTTLAGLVPGTYSFVVQPVEDANARFAPSIVTRQITLAPGETQSLLVDYAEITGRMVVNIDGLTAGLATTIDVAGPAGFSARVSQTDTLRKLVPGTYTLTAGPTSGAARFIPDTALRSVRVDSARVASVVVRFLPVAQLTIQIDGLPTGVAASVDVTGPGFTKHLTAGATLSDLPLGAYVVTPLTVAVGSDTYAATSESRTLTAAGPNAVSVRYERRIGRITVRISGGPLSLPAPVSPIITVNGPTGSFTRSADAVLDNLPLGTYRYTVTAPVYHLYGGDGLSHAPRGAVYSSPLEGRSDLVVTLDAQHPALTIDVPLTFVSGSVTFSAPGSVSVPLGGMGTIELLDSRRAQLGSVRTGEIHWGLPAGTYTGTPYITGSPNNWFIPELQSATGTVSANSPVGAIVIPYHLYRWPAVSIVYSGMPAGLNNTYRVTSSDWFADRLSQFTGETILPNDLLAFPGTKHLEVIDKTVARDTSAAWVASPSAFDFVVQEGVRSTVTIAMRPTNIFQIIISGNPLSSPGIAMPAGLGSITYPDGRVVDFQEIGSNGGLVLLVDQPVGAYVVKANPVQSGGKTYVPAVASQPVALGAAGRTVLRITYTMQ